MSCTSISVRSARVSCTWRRIIPRPLFASVHTIWPTVSSTKMRTGGWIHLGVNSGWRLVLPCSCGRISHRRSFARWQRRNPTTCMSLCNSCALVWNHHQTSRPKVNRLPRGTFILRKRSFLPNPGTTNSRSWFLVGVNWSVKSMGAHRLCCVCQTSAWSMPWRRRSSLQRRKSLILP